MQVLSWTVTPPGREGQQPKYILVTVFGAGISMFSDDITVFVTEF